MIGWGSFVLGLVVGTVLCGSVGVFMGWLMRDSRFAEGNDREPLSRIIQQMMSKVGLKEAVEFSMVVNKYGICQHGTDTDDDDDGDEPIAPPKPSRSDWSRN